MTPAMFAQRQARIEAGCCPRCGLPVRPWPLYRADRCHVKGAAVCPRHWEAIYAAEAALRVS